MTWNHLPSAGTSIDLPSVFPKHLFSRSVFLNHIHSHAKPAKDRRISLSHPIHAAIIIKDHLYLSSFFSSTGFPFLTTAMNSKHSSGRFTAFVLLIVFACSSVLASVKPTATDPEPNSHAFWVLGCGKPVLVERADPIQYPGVASQHLHTIMGGNAFDFDLDYDKTQASTCTTCSVTKDLSNYWVPTVYFHAENGSFISVPQVGGLNVYYQYVTQAQDIIDVSLLT